MTIWPLPEHGDEHNSLSSKYSSLFTPPNSSSLLDSNPISPRLEVGNIDAVPFSQNFADLFDGLGLHVPPAKEKQEPWRTPGPRSPDSSYEIESYTNMKDLDPEWKHNEIEEIMVMSPKRPGGLATIHEEATELSINVTINDKATPLLSDFVIEDLDPPCSRDDPTFNTKMCTRRDDKSGKKYLIKRRRIKKDSSWVERDILQNLTSRALPFVEYLHWTIQNGEYEYGIIDYHPGITLAELVAQQGPLGSHRAMFYASELVSAVSSLHDAGIVHRDIHPRNIVLDAKGHIVLTNFAHAEFLTSKSSGSSEGSVAWNLSDFKMNEYRAPELYLGWSHDGAVDCWSFGMMLYFMFFARNPYGGSETEDDRWFYDRVVGFAIPTEALRLVHPMARDLVLKCLERNASMRWTMNKIKTHGYFGQVDWDQVHAKKVDVPSFGGLAIEVNLTNNVSESQKRRLSLNPLLLDNSDRQSFVELGNTLRRSNSLREPSSDGRHGMEIPRSAPNPHVSHVLKPAVNISIPTIIHEEDESTSISASTGHICEERHPRPTEEASASADTMSRFWADIDREEEGKIASSISLELGGSNGAPYTNAPKLRKHRSAIQTTHRLFNLSTSSFHKKLRRKPRSTGALQQQQSKPIPPIEGLPNGIHQIGSGIGFTYNVPNAAAAASKVSVCSIVPPTCTHLQLFQGRFGRRGLALGGRKAGKEREKGKAKGQVMAVEDVVIDVSSAGVDHEEGMGHASDMDERLDEGPSQDLGMALQAQAQGRQEVGNGTFIREMYRSPSWILSPPENVPSPMALVNSDLGAGTGMIASPLTTMNSPAETELLTPATLVNFNSPLPLPPSGELEYGGEEEVTISIPKGLQIDLDLDLDLNSGRGGQELNHDPDLSELASDCAPDSTLRLVPRASVPMDMRLSYAGGHGGGRGHGGYGGQNGGEEDVYEDSLCSERDTSLAVTAELY